MKRNNTHRAVKAKAALFSRGISSARLKYDIAPFAITKKQNTAFVIRTSLVSLSLYSYQGKAHRDCALSRNGTIFQRVVNWFSHVTNVVIFERAVMAFPLQSGVTLSRAQRAQYWKFNEPRHN